MEKGNLLWEMLLRYKKRIFFNTPGHLQGRIYGSNLPDLNLWRYDLTELAGVPPYEYPPAVVAKVEEKVAGSLGAEWCRFLYNGATAGILAMFLGMLKPGERVLLPRAVHYSVISALILSGAEPVFLYPPVDAQWGIPAGIPVETWQQTINNSPNLKAVFVTSPSYQGLCHPLRQICRLAHARNIPVLVDEAHGGLLAFDEEYEHSACRAGADLWVWSMHKNLGAPTQTGVIFGRKSGINFSRLNAVLKMIQSSSPSYPLLAGLEHACSFVLRKGSWLFHKAKEESAYWKCFTSYICTRLAKVDGIPSQFIISGQSYCCIRRFVYWTLLGKKIFPELPELIPPAHIFPGGRPVSADRLSPNFWHKITYLRNIMRGIMYFFFFPPLINKKRSTP